MFNRPLLIQGGGSMEPHETDESQDYVDHEYSSGLIDRGRINSRKRKGENMEEIRRKVIHKYPGKY